MSVFAEICELAFCTGNSSEFQFAGLLRHIIHKYFVVPTIVNFPMSLFVTDMCFLTGLSIT